MRRIAAGLGIALVAVLATATPAWAHNYLVSSTPVEGEVLTALPEHFSVTTNEPLLDLSGEGSGFGLEIIDADGLYYGDGCVTVEGASVFADPVIGAAGSYTLVYQVVSADGHTVSDSFEFEWAPAAGFEAAEGTASPGDCNGLYNRGEVEAETSGETSIDLSTVLWIGGAVGAVLIAVIVTLLLLRPKKQ